MRGVARDLTFHQMRLFVTLADEGSFTRAALTTGITQSTLSRMVKHKEQLLGELLFERSGRGIALNGNGWVLYNTAVEILGLYDRSVEEIRSAGGVLHGHCQVVMPESAGRILFLPLIKDIRQRHPNCSIHVSAAVSATIPTMLQTRQADVAMVTDTHAHIGLEVWPIARESLYLIGLAGDPLIRKGTIPLRRLAGLPLLLPASPNGIRRRIDESFAASGIEVNLRQEIDVTEALIDMVSGGDGYSIMPFSSVYREVGQGQLGAARITSPTMSRTLFGALAQGRPAAPVEREVARSLLPLARRFGPVAKWKTES